MTFAAPLFALLGLGVAAAAVAFHFIVTRQPSSRPLPTARFVPDGSVHVVTVTRPTDLLLMALRVALALVVGTAFAGPTLVPSRRPIVRLVAADVSHAVGSRTALRDSVGALLRAGDVLVVFDSSARAIRSGVADSAAALERTERQGRLSVALIAALRSATQMRSAADSLELIIVSPFRANELDGATAAIRRGWPGRIRLVPIPASTDSLGAAAGMAVIAPPDDPVGLAAVLLAAPPSSPATVRIIRGTPTPADSVWASEGRRTLVRWPADGAPPGWVARGAMDTVGAVVSGFATLVVPLARQWQLAPSARPARIIARWVDGAPAAVDYIVGLGCIRDVAIPVPTRGDVMLRPSFARFLEALGAPCTATESGRGLTAPALEQLRGSGPLAAAAAIAPPDTTVTPLVPWLLSLALLLALVELMLRRQRSRP